MTPSIWQLLIVLAIVLLLFGRGKILAIQGNGSAAKMTIQFSGNIRKKLIAKYANLTQLKT